MTRLLRHQPFKGLYLTFQLFSTVLVRIPLWVALAIPPSWRPRAQWSIRRVVQLKLLRLILAITKTTGNSKTPNHTAITPVDQADPHSPAALWISPIPSQLVRDELAIWATAADISPVRIPGYWLNKKGSHITVSAPPMPGEKVVYALHGGGFRALSAHPSDPTAAIAHGLLQHVDTVQRVFSCEYRLTLADSSGNNELPNRCFPGALIDALAGYIYLVETVGFDPQDIIVEGDSAGGNLALALTRYLVEHPNSGFPAPPGALVLLSPWVNLGTPISGVRPSWINNARCDYIGPDVDIVGYLRAAGAYVGPHGLGAADINPYISSASVNPTMKVDFKGFPRTFITSGGAEVFYDMHCVLRDRMVRDLGPDMVRFHFAPHAVHDWLGLTFHEPERTEALREIAAWLTS
ncbi:Alpha/Beta hydrolase protein [Rhodocollybia butyracea]|uniref:Alpha/Beta hydrolase protein n=1 Tax=Rhodocollybia butyracea TaxID=206335 RepID=A0A9P5PYS9_9AGAR|nr:Alpha/Beta hydrolase protein [Rhodocollybia butyracea]